MSKNSSMNAGASLHIVIFLIFLILKLTDTGPVAEWSWFWVFSPLWIPTAAAFAIIGLAALAFASVYWLTAIYALLEEMYYKINKPN